MTTTPDVAPSGKSQRRRHLLQRQTIIFGTLTVILVAFALAALGVFLRILPAPFSSEFTDLEAQQEASLFTPCPAPGALPVPYETITANVFNGTDQSGLAGSTSEAISGVGVVIGTTANYAAGAYPGATLIVAGEQGVPAAYTLAALFPGAEIQFDAARADAVIDLVVGDQYVAMNDPAVSTLDPALPLVGLEGCQLPSDTTDAA
ncbi:hypothetical protein C8046_14340 [Serinibacter arcticus]|uniref:LytR/CpsA/Psr regulator C-terminal domain-containing protein n=1 Tax=Serinibacter arcticus TaxID=1655435 RepID=A0A2U1ZXE1_9MICO|nr:LytR C-terminal domain-containing protein [Serinibacter arcticus]PWD51649.1 hypothetical protein C8046_14340 [Serinibacter arcticus]